MKKRLLMISDDPNLTSGLGRIGRELSRRFIDKFEFRVAAWHRLPTAHNFPFFIYELDKGTTKSKSDLELALNDYMPDIIFLVGDLWDFAVFRTVLPSYKDINPNTKVVGWITVDGECLHSAWSDIVHLMDEIATFSYFGQKEIERLSKVKPEVIYPGVDHDIFFEREISLKTKQSVSFNPKTNFVVLNLNQNTDRKNIPLLLEVFAEFSIDKPEAFLFLATDPMDPQGFDLWDIIKYLKLSKKVAVTRDIFPVGGVQDVKLSFIYNLASVFVSTSIGEGYGLAFNEAMACGIPILATNYTTPSELLANGRGKTVNVAAFIRGAYGIKRAIVCKDDLIVQLNILYKDWKESGPILKEYKQKSKEFIKSFTWDKTADQLIKLIDKTGEKKTRDWVKKDIITKDIRLLMVAPSWGKNCGIAEYTNILVEHIRMKNLGVMIFPSADLDTLIGFAEKHNLNVLHFQHEFSFWPDKTKLEVALKKLNDRGIKTVVTMHSFCKGLSSYNLMISELASKVILHAVTLKEEYKALDDLIAEFKPNLQNVGHIPMGCELPLPLEIKDVEDTRKRLNIIDRAPIVGSFGFLREQKGYKDLILAVKKLQKKYPKILCLIYAPPHEFGSKFYDEQFFKFIEREKLDDVVMLIRDYSKKEKMLKILQTADLFVLNYMDNPAGGGISAAVKTLMRTQRPIITTDSIAFRDLDKEVFKIKDSDVGKLVDVIDQVLMNEDLKNKLVEKANVFLKDNTWDKIASQHLKIYGD